MNATLCPCGSARPYASCCGALHQSFSEEGQLLAASAEALMRSRYSAFVLDLRPYLLATWHPRTRPTHLEPPEPGLSRRKGQMGPLAMGPRPWSPTGPWPPAQQATPVGKGQP